MKLLSAMSFLVKVTNLKIVFYFPIHELIKQGEVVVSAGRDGEFWIGWSGKASRGAEL